MTPGLGRRPPQPRHRPRPRRKARPHAQDPHSARKPCTESLSAAHNRSASLAVQPVQQLLSMLAAAPSCRRRIERAEERLQGGGDHNLNERVEASWSSTREKADGRMREMARRGTAVLLSLLWACSGSGRSSSMPRSQGGVGAAGLTASVIRYRLPLRNNPVDSGQAFRCYGHCQSAETPQRYLQCLAECPGFEITPDAICGKDEVPPAAVCLTGRRMLASEKMEEGAVVLAVVGSFVIVVGAIALCASSKMQCSYDHYWYGWPGRP